MSVRADGAARTQAPSRDPIEVGEGRILRPARPGEIAAIRCRLIEAIDQSPYYGERFKAHERSRYTSTYLHALHAIDPWHVALALRRDVPTMIVISMPEFGTLWSPWFYTLPEMRGVAEARVLARGIIPAWLRRWDHGRYHKVACYVRPANRSSYNILTRSGFAEVARLENHIFGEDVILLERKLTKAADGYDNGVDLGRLGLWRRRTMALLGRV